MASPSPVDVSSTALPVYAATPLPPGWTEHRAPTGQFYYYHAATQESTYVRPSIATVSSTEPMKEKKKDKKKEKPKIKKPIPGTSWLKVITTDENVFYTNTETKLSVWTVPEEIKDVVRRLEEEETRAVEEAARQAEQEKLAKAEETRRAHEAEQNRIIELEVKKVRAEVEAEAALRGLKRKPDESSTSSLEPQPPLTSKSALPGPGKGSPPTPDSSLEGPRKLQKLNEEQDQDEEWQRQIAEEMALEAEQEVKAAAPQTIKLASPAVVATAMTTMLTGLNPDELKATFKAMLLEKSIDPMAPWDNELPKFVTDPRYLALSSMKERRDLFDEFCKEKIRQRRAEKQATTTKLDPAQAYRSLLIEAVTSTRTHWEEFRTKYKKDTRFRNFGRDDREREKAFKRWLKELGEHKRVEAIKAEEEFMRFLNEKREELERSHPQLPDAQWKSVRDSLKKDKRFDIITSNTIKEGIWKKWVTRLNEQGDKTAAVEGQEAKKEKQEASLKAREEEVRRQRERLEKQTDKNRSDLGRDEAERAFRSLLVDAVRDHDATWETLRSSLEKDPRFQQSRTLSLQTLKRLFADHTASIYAKRLSALESFFEEHATSLATPFATVKKKLMSLIDDMSNESSQSSMSPDRLLTITTINRLIDGRSRNGGLETIECFFDSWKAKKEARAREEFEEMCGESAFIDFWCRMKNAAKDNVVGSTTIGEEGQEEDEDEVVDLRDMAKSIDLSEIETVLKKDKRWIVWDHDPDKRELWIRAYLENLAAPKLTVYQKT
ncbi:hypothetical protein CROQUDRAFT_654300 [Cronartium quercuum f. sp. fusiforme G11]|uniref:Transcription elongation regulator 1 n=1 Tax=Cronartium quercuum f. sp. fusiforme G11 TaxID=708437 RepID=A0A9P6NRI5_9BASI|nr:hypothetical protein CROQUDRAFT_654300 [Cronartium quercuum f. sp. fusiforme G11]